MLLHPEFPQHTLETEAEFVVKNNGFETPGGHRLCVSVIINLCLIKEVPLKLSTARVSKLQDVS